MMHGFLKATQATRKALAWTTLSPARQGKMSYLADIFISQMQSGYTFCSKQLKVVKKKM